MSNTYVSEGNQIVLKEEFGKILVDFEMDYFMSNDNVHEKYSKKLLELFNKTISDLEAKLAESENKHLLDETEWQDYCAFKHIEPQIKGCLDREREYQKQLEEKQKEIEELKGERLKFYTDDVRRTQVINGIHFDMEQLLVFSEYVEHEKWVIAEQDKEINELKQQHQDKISFAVEQLEKVKEFCDGIKLSMIYISQEDTTKIQTIIKEIDNQIKQLKEGN